MYSLDTPGSFAKVADIDKVPLKKRRKSVSFSDSPRTEKLRKEFDQGLVFHGVDPKESFQEEGFLQSNSPILNLLGSMKVKDLLPEKCCSDLTFDEKDTLAKVIESMYQAKVLWVPVKRGDALIRCIDVLDIASHCCVRFSGATDFYSVSYQLAQEFETRTIKDLFDTPPNWIALDVNTPALKMVQLFALNSYKTIGVTDGEKILGIITQFDTIQVLLKNKDKLLHELSVKVKDLNVPIRQSNHEHGHHLMDRAFKDVWGRYLSGNIAGPTTSSSVETFLNFARMIHSSVIESGQVDDDQITKEDSVEVVLEIFCRKNCSQLTVLDEGRQPIGTLHLQDILRLFKLLESE